MEILITEKVVTPGSEELQEHTLGSGVTGEQELEKTSGISVDLEALPERLGDFRLLERLGLGGSGIVFRAVHESTNEIVALKMLHLVRPEAVANLKSEFRALAKIRHENLVQLMELGCDQGIWFFTMEFIEGVDFISFVRPTNDEALNLSRLRFVTTQLALALTAAHNEGLLHLDVKPSNILVTPQGRVVLLDFGLVRHLKWDSVQSGRKRFQGTPAYMAPEQIRGIQVDAAADWYAFGGVLYQALSGRLPFNIEGSASLVTQKIHGDPIALCELKDSGSVELGAIALQLLARDPAMRLTGPQLLARLRASDEKLVAKTSGEKILFGRDAELQRLAEAVLQAHDERVIVKLSGPSGIGKTTLLQNFVGETRKRSSVVAFNSRCHERANIPYRAFDDGIEQLVSFLLSSSSYAEARAQVRRSMDLLRIFPTLSRIGGPESPGAVDSQITDPGEARRRGFDELIALFAMISKDKTLVLSFDDLQWSDEDSALLLQELLEDERIERLLLVLSFRSDLPEGPVLQNVRELQSQFRDSQIHDIEVQPLGVQMSEELVAHLLGEDDQVEPRRLARMAAGNPLLIEELVAQTRIERFLSQPPENVIEVEDLILARFAQLPLVARKVLELCSIAERPLTNALVGLALGDEIDELALVQMIDMLQRYHLLQPGTKLEPYHAMTRRSVAGLMGDSVQHEHHRALIKAYRSSLFSDPNALAHHYRAVGDRQNSGQYALYAARQTAKNLAFQQAVELYYAALHDLENSPFDVLDEIRLELAEALGNAGRGKEAAAVYLDCATRKKEHEMEYRAKAATHFLASGELDRGAEVYDALLKEHRVKVPKGRFGMILGIVRRFLWLKIRGTRITLKDDAEIPRAVRQRIDLLLVGWRGYASFSPLIGTYFSLVAFTEALRVGYRIGVINGLEYYGLIGSYSATKNSIRSSMKTLAQARDLCHTSNDTVLRARVGLSHGIANAAIGDFAGAVQKLDETSRRLERCTGVNWEMATLENTRIQALFWLGQYHRARQQNKVLLRRSEQSGDRFTTLTSAIYNSIIKITRSEVDVARQQISEALEQWTTKEYTYQHFFALKAKIWCDIYDELPAQALNRLEKDLAAIKSSGLMALQLFKSEFLYLEGTILLAVAAQEGSRKFWAKIRENIRTLEKGGKLYTRGYAEALRLGLAFQSEEEPEQKRASKAAIEIFEKAEMFGHASAVRLSCGDFEGADWLSRQQVAEPLRWAGLYVVFTSKRAGLIEAASVREPLMMV